MSRRTRRLAATRALQRDRRQYRDEPPCWCGAEHPYYAPLRGGCDGFGMICCECGGDNLCVCHHHGEVECFGCPECEYDDEYAIDHDDLVDDATLAEECG